MAPKKSTIPETSARKTLGSVKSGRAKSSGDTSSEKSRKDLADQTPPVTLGNRLQRTRQSLGLSIRDLADKAGVNKDTIVKLEKGNTPSYRTLCRVCDGLGVSVVQLLKPEADSKFRDAPVSVHARKKETRVSAKNKAKALVGDVDHRQILANDEGIQLSWLACRLPGGQMNSWILELREETEPTTHAGEEFIFCLKGSAKLTVAGKVYELSEGDAATFWSAEPHSYGPSDHAIKSEQLPVLLLSVWISSADKVRN